MILPDRLYRRLSTFLRFLFPRPSHSDFVPENVLRPSDWEQLSAGERKVWQRFYPLFDVVSIRSIVLVGANDGTLALNLNRVFPGRDFYLFEPVPDSYMELERRIESFVNMRAGQLAIGSVDDVVEMFVDKYLPASSLLAYKPLALKEFPNLGYQSHVEVQVRPLDSVLSEWGIKRVDLLIIDTQGYEDLVLAGATETLKHCKAVVSELNIQPLYEGSSTFDSVYQALRSNGFQLVALFHPIAGVSQQILQIDGVFICEAKQS